MEHELFNLLKDIKDMIEEIMIIEQLRAKKEGLLEQSKIAK